MQEQGGRLGEARWEGVGPHLGSGGKGPHPGGVRRPWRREPGAPGAEIMSRHVRTGAARPLLAEKGVITQRGKRGGWSECRQLSVHSSGAGLSFHWTQRTVQRGRVSYLDQGGQTPGPPPAGQPSVRALYVRVCFRFICSLIFLDPTHE